MNAPTTALAHHPLYPDRTCAVRCFGCCDRIWFTPEEFVLVPAGQHFCPTCWERREAARTRRGSR